MTAELKVDMKGKVAVVTGATAGIGKEIARGLARMGATLVIGARSPERAKAAVDDIRETTGNSSITVLDLDVAEAGSIRAFAKAFSEKFDKLDVLVNNAGAWFTDKRENSRGCELTFATNVLGPYLLTEVLAEPLAKAKGRVVNLASAFASDYDPEDLEFKKRSFDGFKAYKASKQALRMLTWGQAAALGKKGVMVNAASPGFVKTEMNRNAHGFTAAMINFSAKLFADTPAGGADTPLWVAVSPELAGVSAKFYEKRKEKQSEFREAEPIADLERRCSALVA